MDARIGTLANGQFYAFVNGYDAAEVRGTIEQVEVALGLREALSPVSSVGGDRYNVTMFFQHPAWDEKNGIFYGDILATSKADAISTARQMAREDGHAMTGKGRYWFVAVEEM